MTGNCAARLVGDQALVCDRNRDHYTKDHRATGSWMTSDGRLVTAVVTWPTGEGEWEGSS